MACLFERLGLVWKMQGRLEVIAAFDPDLERIFMTTGAGVEVIDVSDPPTPRLITMIDIVTLDAESTSVSAKNGVVAVAPGPESDPGQVGFFDPAPRLSSDDSSPDPNSRRDPIGPGGSRKSEIIPVIFRARVFRVFPDDDSPPRPRLCRRDRDRVR